MASNVNGKWETLPSMLVKRGNVNTIAHQNKIYVFGGCLTVSQVLKEAEVYDVCEKQWRKLPDIPRPRNHVTMVTRGNDIFLIGGYTLQGKPVHEVDVFNTESESWDLSYPSLSTEVTMYITAITIDKDIYIMGGANHKGDVIKNSFVLQEDSKVWKSLASLSTGRYSAKAYHHNEKIYLIGGRAGQNSVNVVDIYDIKNNEWKLKKADGIPKKRVFASSVRHNDIIYFLNGLNPPVNFHNTVECFDLNKEEWSRIKSTPFSRADTSVGVINHCIVVAGGMCEYGPNQVTEIFDTKTNAWCTVDEAPTPRIQTGSVVIDGMFVMLGGIGLQGHVDSVEALVIQ